MAAKGAAADARGGLRRAIAEYWSRYRQVARREFLQIVRIVLTAAAAWQVCVWLGATLPPVYAVAVPLLSMRDDPFTAFNVSAARLVGVVSGLLVGIVVLHWTDPNLLAVAAMMAVSLLIGTVLRIGNTLNIQVAVSALLVLSTPNAPDYAFTRFWETGVGTAVTFLLAPFLFPADPLAAAQRELNRISDNLTAGVRAACVAIGSTDEADRARVLLHVQDGLRSTEETVAGIADQVRSAAKSAPWTLLRRREMRAVAALGPVQQLAARLCADLDILVRDGLRFSARPELGTETTLRKDNLALVGEPLEAAIRMALRDEPPVEPVAQALAAIDGFRGIEHSRAASVIRRPLHRMVEALHEFIGGGRPT